MTKNQRNKLFEHKDKTRGSIRVWKKDIFYNLNANIKRIKINDGISEALIIPSACTKALTIILNRFGIEPKAITIEGKRLKKKNEIPGLNFDSIKTIKGDHDHLRINYSSHDGEGRLAAILLSQLDWLQNHKITFGEADGTQACIRGICQTFDQLKEKQKTLNEI